MPNSDQSKLRIDVSLLNNDEAIRRGKRYHSAEIPLGTKLVGAAFEQKRVGESYESFYSRGGWTYDTDSEATFLVHRILKPLNICPGSQILELGCGTGFHSWLLCRLGMAVTAIDSCPAAIGRAKHYHGVTYECTDVNYFISCCEKQFDMIFARGMSWFHYELEPGPNSQGVDVDKAMTAVMRILKSNGLFVLQIRTNFTGTYDTTGVRNHSWQASRNFLMRHGKIELFTDWYGVPLDDATSALRSGGNLLAAIAPQPRQPK